MPGNTYYIPSKDEEFDGRFKFLSQLVIEWTSGTPPEWPHVPKTAVDRVGAAYADWYLPYSRMLKPHTPLDTRTKNQAKKAGKSVMVSFTNEHIRNS